MLHIIMVLLVLTNTNLEAKVLTLDSLKESFKKNSFELKAVRSHVLSHELNVKEQKSKLYPKFGIQLGKENLSAADKSEQEKIQAIYGQLNLFNGFKDVSAISKSKLQVSVSNNFLKNKYLLGELEIEKLFYQYLFLKKKQNILSSELSRSMSHIKMVEKRLSSKIITETDLLEFKLYKNKLESLLKYIELELKSIQNELLITSGFDIKNEYTILGKLPHYFLTENLNELLERSEESYEVKQHKLKTEIAKSDLKSTKADWYPNIDLRLEHGHLDEAETGIDSDEVSSRAVVLATWELFSGGQTKYSEKSQMNNVKSFEYSYKQANLNYEIGVRNLFNKLKMLEKTISSEEVNAKLSESLYERTMKEYKKGIKDSGALSNSSKEFSEIESRVFQLKFNYVLAKIELAKLISKRLNLRVIEHNKD
jgi:outer membrane protein TolC